MKILPSDMRVDEQLQAYLPHKSFNKRYVFGISLIASLGGLMFGFDLGAITGVIPFIKLQFQLDGFTLGWVVAIFELGCMCGTFVIAWLADKFGRKKSLILTAIWLIITTLGVSLSPTSFTLALWRFFQGVAVGATSVLSPMYIAEISPAKMRGKLVSVNQLSIILGILLATYASYYFGNPDYLESWRLIFGSALIPSIIFLLALFLIPETPRWLVKTQANDKAVRVLRKIGDDNFAGNALSEIEASLQENKREGSYRELLSMNIFPILLVGFGLAVLQQFCGANNITAYMQVIFEKANISFKSGLFNAVFVMLIFFIFTIVAIILVDKIGRKKLMLIGTALMALFLFLLAWSFNSQEVDGRLVLIFIIGYIATFASTLGPVVWVLLSEIFPTYIRSKALSLSSAVLWLATFVVVLVSPSLLKLSPIINFIIFGCFNIFGFFFVWRYVPETKGKSLEELEIILTKQNYS